MKRQSQDPQPRRRLCKMDFRRTWFGDRDKDMRILWTDARDLRPPEHLEVDDLTGNDIACRHGILSHFISHAAENLENGRATTELISRARTVVFVPTTEIIRQFGLAPHP